MYIQLIGAYVVLRKKRWCQLIDIQLIEQELIASFSPKGMYTNEGGHNKLKLHFFF